MTKEQFRELAQSAYFGNTLADWAIAIALFALLFTVLPIAHRAIRARLRRPQTRAAAQTLELVQALASRTTRLFEFALALWIAMRWLVVPPNLEFGIGVAVKLVFWLQVGLWGSTLVTHLIQARARANAAAEGAASLNILRFIALTGVWAVALLMLLANLGVEIMPLIAGLGIGGVAIALAVQNVLGDLLASLSIALDKPFKVGDFLILGTELGTVEHIGIKSTRLRSLSGEQIVISNGDLLRSRVRNYGRMYERRVVFGVNIPFDTPLALVHEVPGILERAIRARDKVRFDRAHLAKMGEYALEYEAVYYVLDPGYNRYMDTQQAINYEILAELEKRGIGLAVPTRRNWPGSAPGAEAREPA